jgi:segregation and condensation protein A
MRAYRPRTSPYQIVLPVFEGPLDLLLHLIHSNRLDIYDIPVAEVTDQYIRYLAVMESLDLEVAGEFLVMAATLLEIKSRMLLPPDPTAQADEEPEDPRAELVDRLIEYQRYKEAAEHFREREIERMKVFTSRRQYEIDYAPFLLKDLTPADLLEALRRLLAEVGEGEHEVTTVARRRITVRMRMSEIWRRVSASDQPILFEDLFEEPLVRSEVVITFLAILELLRLRRIVARQSRVFDRIEIAQFDGAPRRSRRSTA